MLLQSRRGLLCCGCGGSAGAVVAGGARAAAAVLVGEETDGHKPGAHTAEQIARRVSWAQVESMTRGFTSGVVGEGGFSTVYLGRVGGSPAAVKVHRRSERVQRAFRQELEALLRVRHPHIVRLLAFCCDDQDQQAAGVLVLELAPNGSLHDHLHRHQRTVMPWPRRVAVALQVARALEYLHHRCEPQVVHGDVKASNVLLDAAMAARLCDFGSARAGFLSARRGVLLGSPGYVDPHYLRSGVLTSKSDVYSFGALLLEMLTGLQPFQHGPRLLAATTTPPCDLVDRRLGCRYDATEAKAMVALAAACVGDNPTLRPSMADVVRALERTAHASIGTRSDGGGKQ
ncbi:unnamed protein product [Urochloa decumbens]|uniref:Protein kinase domain-containing protein n=1 Tax=Urochloa decumbens TaxID=240449 RepID=A0ABC8WLQ2_9POAL